MDIKPTDSFYLLANINLDGTLDVSSEGPEPMTLAHARERASEIVGAYGCEQVIIKCKAVQTIDIHDTDAFKELRNVEIRDDKLDDLLDMDGALQVLIHTFITQYEETAKA